ncbi:hypothetical protein V6N13_038338 [Hibiscus sabdariffa]
MVCCVCSPTVRIIAFQAIDPGSIPDNNLKVQYMLSETAFTYDPYGISLVFHGHQHMTDSITIREWLEFVLQNFNMHSCQAAIWIAIWIAWFNPDLYRASAGIVVRDSEGRVLGASMQPERSYLETLGLDVGLECKAIGCSVILRTIRYNMNLDGSHGLYFQSFSSSLW